MAGLISRYFAEVEAFNTVGIDDDDELDAIAEATFDVTIRKLVGVPVRTSGDAIAAIDWILAEGEHSRIDFSHGEHGAAASSLLKELRIYMEGSA